MKKHQNTVRNKNEKRKTRNRRMAGALAFVLVAVMVLSIIAPLLIKGADNSSPQIEISGELGFLRKYKVNGSTPVKINLENKGGDFKGELQIRISNINDPSYERNTVYACPVELSAGMAKSYDMVLEIPVIKTSFDVSVVNSNGAEIAKEALETVAVDPTEIMIGALADDRNALNYFRQMPLNASRPNQQNIIDDKLVFLDENSMPDEVSVMNNFNFFIINNFDTGRLSEKQLKALSEWVDTGGVLLLGGGPNYSKVFKGLGTIVETESRGKSQVTELDELAKSIGKKISNNSPIALERIIAKDSVEIIAEGGESLISAVQRFNGQIIIHNFDLGIAPIPEINRTSAFLERLYLPYVSEAIRQKSSMVYDYYSSFYNTNILLSDDDMNKIYIIFIIVGLYCLVIGPILYFILKRMDMREKAIIIIPAIALVTVLAVGVVSLGSAYRMPIISVNSMITFEGGGKGSIESVASAYSPSKGEIKLEFDRNVPIKPIDNRYYYSVVNPSVIDEKKITFGDKTGISFYGKEKWDANSFRNKGIVDINGSVECELAIEGERLVGVIKNNTALDFYDVLVGVANEFQKFDFLGSNETLEIDLPLPDNSHMPNSVAYISQIYREGNYQLTDLSTRERQVLRIRENMLDYFVSNRAYNNRVYSYSYGSTSVVGAVSVGSYYTASAQQIYAGGSIDYDVNNLLNVSVYGFNYDDMSDYSLSINGREPTKFNVNLFKIDAGLDFKPGSFVRIPSWMIAAELEAGEVEVDFYDSLNIFTHNEGEMIFGYTVPEMIELSEFRIEWDINNNPLGMDSTALLYNNKTDEWDTIEFNPTDNDTMRFDCNDTESYIDDGRYIRMKVYTGAGLYISLPGFGIEGYINEGIENSIDEAEGETR